MPDVPPALVRLCPPLFEDVPVFARCDIHGFFKQADKGGAAVNSDGLRDVFYGKIGLCKHLAHVLHADVVDIVRQIFTGCLFENARDVFYGKAHILRYFFKV